jgi:N-acyl-D-aspartate/D-glutamate deacylase
MPEYDVVIRGGTLVDGTGIPAYRADLGLAGGKVVAIEDRLSASDGKRDLDAGGLVVAPGFVDLHTHYDSQIQWDPYCTISGWHGVTSVTLGNCGFGFAPVQPEDRERSMLMMSRNEAISFEAMQEGMLWDWVTFPEWMDSLERMPKGINCLTYLPLSPLLIWVMGLEAARTRGATDDERDEMCRLLGEALDQGACGWTVQRFGPNSAQRDYDGAPMPTDCMVDRDVLALAEVLAQRQQGSIQISQLSDFNGDEETSRKDIDFLELLAATAQRPVLFNAVAVIDAYPELHRERLRWLADCHRRGIQMFGQGNNVRLYPLFTFEHFNLWDYSEPWKEATLGSQEEKLRKLGDPARRAALIADHELVSSPLGVVGPPERFVVRGCGTNPDLQRYVGRLVGDIAAEEGKHAIDVVLDLSVAGGLKVEFSAKDVTSSDPELVAEIIDSPYAIPGISDGGAHSKFFTGGAYPTDLLAYLVRDQGALSLESAHYHLSRLPAHVAGMRDRGWLGVGTPADIVVYDLDELALVPEEGYDIVFDQPTGDWRRVQRAKGYHWTLVNGEITFEDGECTGATPGRFLRHGLG